MLDENAPAEPETHEELTDTVQNRLEYFSDHAIKHINLYFQKEASNQMAKADLIVEDIVLIQDAPSTFLLGMEEKLKEIRSVYESIPTLQSGVKWEIDKGHEKEGVYRASHDVVKNKTARSIESKVLHPGTDKHPPQIEKWMVDVKVGEVINTYWSGMLSPADKAKRLERLDTLLAACKRARTRANSVDAKIKCVAHKLFHYIDHNELI